MRSNPHAPLGFKNHVPRFYTKTGWLTWYGLACGYVEHKLVDGLDTSMWHEGGPCLHVRQSRLSGQNWIRVFWDTFDGPNKLTEARERFLEA